MNWYAGNIAEAVTLAKTRGAIFVVYVEGTDELSQKLTSIINESAIRTTLESTSFVAIKIQSDSEAYVQFAQIYKLVPLPSLFFIGSNGQPIDIVTGAIASSQELSDRIKSVASRAQINLPSASTTNVEPNVPGPSTTSTAQSSSPTAEVVCEGDVCRKVTKPSETLASSEAAAEAEAAAAANTKSLEDKMKLAKELLEKKKQDKEKEEAKDLETQRRQTGRDLQSFKERQHELDLLQMKEERQKDKLADQAARKRILDQIAQDRAERAQRLNLVSTPAAAEVDTSKKSVPPKLNADFTRIQFKKPDGESEMHTFNSTDKFQILRTYVAESVVGGSIRDYTLASTFPRKEYTVEDDNKSLNELDLAPSAVILILPSDKSRNPLPIVASGLKPLGMVNGLFWGAFGQLLSIFNYLKRLIWRQGNDNSETGAQKRASEETISANDMAKRRNLRYPLENQAPSTSQQSASSGGPYRRHEGSNIHRLHDNKESDDENNTWNGNSTQQQ
ncbi:UBX domain-containing protein 4 isoform X2 [Bradysia coprophila]|uniref:UBX domain-containing protein 4 isoform X2 n=1 Tax=Bradysia coprophila TaxID=38358 RepID=UPI00187D7D39|nr:UBX domain-containing protein 4 isoform X2 [Bradysia coprophila]